MTIVMRLVFSSDILSTYIKDRVSGDNFYDKGSIFGVNYKKILIYKEK